MHLPAQEHQGQVVEDQRTTTEQARFTGAGPGGPAGATLKACRVHRHWPESSLALGCHVVERGSWHVFGRKIVGWNVYDRECGELASSLVRRAVMAEGCLRPPDILHADNGSPQKSSTLRATLEQLGIESTYSRPKVSNDNPYSESLFRTTKYRPDYPVDGYIDMA